MRSVYSFIKYCQTVFQNGQTFFHSLQQCMRVSVASRALGHANILNFSYFNRSWQSIMVLIGISLMACGMIICDYSILFWCQNPLADELNFCPGSNICSHYFVYTFLAVKFTVVKFTVEQMNLPFHTVTSNLELLWTILSTLTRVIFLFYWLEPRVLFVVSPLDRKTCHHHLGGRK